MKIRSIKYDAGIEEVALKLLRKKSRSAVMPKRKKVFSWKGMGIDQAM